MQTNAIDSNRSVAYIGSGRGRETFSIQIAQSGGHTFEIVVYYILLH